MVAQQRSFQEQEVNSWRGMMRLWDYKIQKTYHKITRQLSPLTLVMEIAALQQKVCKSVVLD